MADGLLDRLGAKARRQIVDNLSVLEQMGATQGTEPLAERAGRVWDIPAKYAFSRKVYRAQEALGRGHSNDLADAMRHAETSRQVGRAAGPVWANAAGTCTTMPRGGVRHERNAL